MRVDRERSDRTALPLFQPLARIEKHPAPSILLVSDFVGHFFAPLQCSRYLPPRRSLHLRQRGRTPTQMLHDSCNNRALAFLERFELRSRSSPSVRDKYTFFA